MSQIIHFLRSSIWCQLGFALLAIMAGLFFFSAPTKAAACTVPSTSYGTATTTLNVPTDAKYKLWTRMYTADAANNSFLLEVDGTNCYTVGGGSIPANTWTWVDYAAGNSASKIEVSLTKGAHTLKLIGTKPNVQLDRIVINSDLNCIVKDTGDVCETPADRTAPTVSFVSPKVGGNVNGTLGIEATAADAVGVAKVEFFDNSLLIGTSAVAPFGTAWDTTKVPNGEHTLIAKAYDAAGNVGVATVTVVVNNGDRSAPSTPTNVQASPGTTSLQLSWNASTDDTGVVGYIIRRDGAVLRQINATSFEDSPLKPDTTYNYTVTAIDASGNASAASTGVSAKTSALSTRDTQAPTVPTSVNLSAVSSSQINLTWSPSTDNIGVASYDVYRTQQGKEERKIATVTSTSFGDTGLRTGTNYSYRIKARDAAGNESAFSEAKSTSTKSKRSVVSIRGRVRDASNNSVVKTARIIYDAGGNKIIYSSTSDGRYSLKFGSGGEYKLFATAPGYESQTVTIQVADGESITRDIMLKKK